MQIPQANLLFRCNAPRFEIPPCPFVGTRDELNEHARKFHSNNVEYARDADHYEQKEYYDKKNSGRHEQLGNRNQGGYHRAFYRQNGPPDTRRRQPGPSWQNNRDPSAQPNHSPSRPRPRQRQRDIDGRAQAQPLHNLYDTHGRNREQEQHQDWNGGQYGQHQGYSGYYPLYPGQSPVPDRSPVPGRGPIPDQGPAPGQYDVPGQDPASFWGSVPSQGPVPSQRLAPVHVPGHYPQTYQPLQYDRFSPPQAAFPYPPGPPDQSHHYPAQLRPVFIMPPPPASPPQFDDEMIPAGQGVPSHPSVNPAPPSNPALLAAVRARMSEIHKLTVSANQAVVHQPASAVPYRASRPPSPSESVPEPLRRVHRWLQQVEPPEQLSPAAQSNPEMPPATSSQHDTPTPQIRARPDVFLRLASMTTSSNPMEALAPSGRLSNQESLEQDAEEDEVEDKMDQEETVVLTMTERRRAEQASLHRTMTEQRRAEQAAEQAAEHARPNEDAYHAIQDPRA